MPLRFWLTPSSSSCSAESSPGSSTSRLRDAGVLIGASDHGVNKSLYCKDPDGLEFEVMWLVPPEYWGAEANEAIVRPLDLVGDRAKFAAMMGAN